MRVKVNLKRGRDGKLVIISSQNIKSLNVIKNTKDKTVTVGVKDGRQYEEGEQICILDPGDKLCYEGLEKPWVLELNDKGYLFKHPEYRPCILGYNVQKSLYLLAITLGSAMRGVLHKTQDSYNDLENFLFDCAVSVKSLEYSEGESISASIGGLWDDSIPVGQMIKCETDGIVSNLTKVPKVKIQTPGQIKEIVQGRWTIKVDEYKYIILYRNNKRPLDGFSVNIDRIIINKKYLSEIIPQLKEVVKKLLNKN